MERKVPLWLLLLVTLLWLLFVIAFAWALRTTMQGDSTSGLLGRVALGVSVAPSRAVEVLKVALGRVEGTYFDEAVRTPREMEDLTGFSPIEAEPGIGLEGLLVRIGENEPVAGWRMLAGAFTIDGEIKNGALLISPDFRVIRYWNLTEIADGDNQPLPESRKLVFGVSVLEDASIIVTFVPTGSIQRFDRCSSRLWVTFGDFHHEVAVDTDANVAWTFLGHDGTKSSIAAIDVESGRILRTITMQDIIDANPDVGVLEMTRLDSNDFGGNSRREIGRWSLDPFHLNDVEPLPANLADRFGQFEPGDLLLSARSLNLVMVFDPETLRIKWWSSGATNRQHDPDWQPDGKVSILNNNMGRKYSEIVSLDPSSGTKTVIYDGISQNFYTRIRGKHQITADGRVLVTSSQQGRAFELSQTGEVAVDFVNTKPGSSDTNYTLSDFAWFAEDALRLSEEACPG